MWDISHTTVNWTDRDQIVHTYTYSYGNGHRQTKNTPRYPKGHLEGLGGHRLKNMGDMPHNWTDRNQIWHTYANASGNGHRLNT